MPINYLLPALLLLSVTTCAQLKQRAIFYETFESSLCSGTMILDSLGYFFQEGGCGCDPMTTISFGRYTIDNGGVVSLRYLPKDSLGGIREIRRRHTQPDSMLTITIYDRWNVPVDGMYGFKLYGSDRDTVVRTNEHGQIIVPRREAKHLLIQTLFSLYEEQEDLLAGNENRIDIYLTLPYTYMNFTVLRFRQPENGQLELRKDGLYDLKSGRQIYCRGKSD